jgi:hypothetical protein
MSEVRPSQVRSRALAEYAVLHRTLDELDAVAARIVAEGMPVVSEAMVVTARLIRQLADYVDLEQLLVLPTVRRVDIWGDIRAAALAKEHETQRDDLSAIERAHRGVVDPQSLASDLRDFAEGLRAVLKREERDVLGVNGLRDDVVQTEAD